MGEQCHMAGKEAGSSMAKGRHGIISEEFGMFYSIENGDSSFGPCSIRIVQNDNGWWEHKMVQLLWKTDFFLNKIKHKPIK